MTNTHTHKVTLLLRPPLLLCRHIETHSSYWSCILLLHNIVLPSLRGLPILSMYHRYSPSLFLRYFFGYLACSVFTCIIQCCPVLPIFAVHLTEPNQISTHHSCLRPIFSSSAFENTSNLQVYHTPLRERAVVLPNTWESLIFILSFTSWNSIHIVLPDNSSKTFLRQCLEAQVFVSHMKF